MNLFTNLHFPGYTYIPGCFTMTKLRLTLPSSPTSFWRKTKLLLLHTHRTLLIWHPGTSFYFQKWNWSWKDAGSIPLRRSRPNRRECLAFWQKRISKKLSKYEGDGWTGVYMTEGTTSRLTAGRWALWWVLWFLQRQFGKFWINPRIWKFLLSIQKHLSKYILETTTLTQGKKWASVCSTRIF